jgi:ABC-type Fe3+ transport system permease subunit
VVEALTMSAQLPIEPREQASSAVAALVLGIVGVVLCPLCGPVAWVLGRKAEQEVDASGGRIGGRGLGTAGKILGIIGTIFIALLIALLLAGIVVDGSSTYG